MLVDDVVGSIDIAPRDAIGVLRAAHLGLATGSGRRDAILALQALDRQLAVRELAAVVDLRVAARGHRQRRGRDAVRALDAAGEVALADDGRGHLADVLHVAGKGKLVIEALHQRPAVLIDHFGLEALVGAVVHRVGQIADRHAAERAGVIGVDGLCRHRQRAEVFLDRVVRRLRATVPNQLIAVHARADLGLAAGGLEGGGLAVHEAGDLALSRQRITIVGLGGDRGGHRQLRRLDLDGAVDELDVEPRGDVLALGVLDDEHVGRCRHLAVGDVLRACRGLGGLKRVALGQGANRYGGAMGRTVVGERAARGGHNHLVGGLGDGQLADGLGLKPVVRPFRRAAPLDPVRVVARADLGLAADQLERDGLAVHQAVDLAAGGQGLAVIGLVGAFGGHRQRCGRNLVCHVNAAGVVALAGHGHRDGARVGRVPGVRQLVVDALDQRLIAVLHDRLLLLGLAAVHDVGRSLDGHIRRSDLLGRDAQHALILGNGVVVSVEALAFDVGDRVRHLAVGNVGGAARGTDVGDLAVDEALVTELLPAGHLGPGERGTVKHLRGAVALQIDRALGDGQLLRAVHIALVVAQARPTKLDRRGIGHVGRRERAGVGRPVLAVKAVLDGHRILRRDHRGGSLRRKRLAVVNLGGGVAAQRDFPVRLCRGHLQRPDGIGAVDIVAFLCGLIERDGVGVRA